ncbi:hypothetical protein D3C75_821010 [compost metagenome]
MGGIFTAHGQEQCRRELVGFQTAQDSTAQAFAEYGFQHGRRCLRVGKMREPVVGNFTTVLVEIFNPLQQSAFHQRIGRDGISGSLLQTADIIRKSIRFNLQRLIRSERRGNPGLERLLSGNLTMVAQIVGRIIRGTDPFYIGTGNQPLGCEAILGNQGIAVVINPPPILRIQLLLHAEIGFQLQRRPMIQRVADCIGQHFAPLGELFLIRGVTGNIFLFDAERSQRPPFVVVPAEPHFGYAAKTLIPGDCPRV